MNLAEKFTIKMKLKVLSLPDFFDGEAQLIQQLFENGMPCFHLRKPAATVEEIEALINKIDASYYNRMIVHDQVELAKKYNLKGVHFSFRTRNEISTPLPNFIKSWSCHSLAELAEISNSVDDAFLSPVYDSISKDGYLSNFKFNDIRADLKQINSCQVFALGGISIDKVEEIKILGFDGIAVLGTLWQSTDPNTVLKQFLTKIK